MFLLIDWGNTRLKYLLVRELVGFCAHHASQKLEIVESVSALLRQLELSGKKDDITQVLIASVRSEVDNLQLVTAMERMGLVPYIAKTSKNACGVECAYQEPERLGIDRWLAIIAAYRTARFDPGEEAGHPVGIIDVGSAITLDIVNQHGMHLGGHILPGKALLTESLLNTANVKTKDSDARLIFFELGRSTSDCVNLGVEQMILGYLIQCITESSQKYQVNRWFISGGGADYWLDMLQNNKRLSRDIGILSEPTLVFQGLAKLYIFHHPITDKVTMPFFT